MIRYLFDSQSSAARALVAVLKHARESTTDFTFGGLTLESLVASGMWLTGDTDAVAEILDQVPGAVRQERVGR